MGTQPKDWYRDRAKELLKQRGLKDAVEATEMEHQVEPGIGPARPGLFRDEQPMVSSGTAPGAWVMLWMWVPDPQEDGVGKEQAPPNQGTSAP